VSIESFNFEFLTKHELHLAQLGGLAERYFATDPNTCLLKLRQLGEVLAKQAAAHTGLLVDPEANQADVLRALRDRGVIDQRLADIFHGLRKTGNAATHQLVGSQREALHQLKMAYQLATWYFRTFHAPGFKPGPFAPPPEPPDATGALRDELADLQKQLEEAHARLQDAEAAAEETRRRKASAEMRALRQAEEAEVWQQLAEEEQQQREQLAAQLAQIQAEAQEQPEQAATFVAMAAEAAEHVVLDEAATRHIIDQQLQAAGWDADSGELRYSRGVRPQKGKNLAIAEWPTSTGPADYALFVGLQLVAFVEAKKETRNVSGAIEQAKRYSRSYVQKSDEAPPPASPWGDYKVPFLFATNGRPYLRQLLTESGIWFLDARRPQNISRALEAWYTPEGLAAELSKNIDQAHDKLKTEPTDYLGLRPYQLDAIKAVEAALEKGQREMLVAMATGTGKTRTCIGLVYRLIKTKRLRRVLFLVDRSALGEQAANAFKDARLEGLQTFSQIFDLKEMGEVQPDPDTKLHIATIQSMVKRLLYSEDDADCPAVDAYDGIVVDECHRGYLLDRELSDAELTFRDEADYISKYRRVLDHFDAVKIGLTATPALHTTEIFGRPVYQYSYREAVIDGFLVDHEPPIRIVTALAEDGIRWRAGEAVQTYTPQTGQLDLITMPDEVAVEVDEFNTKVLTENFNHVVCQELASQIDPSLDEKTIIYCARDTHADTVVRLLKDALQEVYGEVEDDAVVKITGAADKPLQLIRRFKNERLPNIAVTVDLLTTGVDIPPVANLVFIRRVRSRILYEQMMGRATRLCPEIGKEAFRIFDAVDIYAALEQYTDMKPVVVNPSFTFEQLINDLAAVTTEDARREVIAQVLAKLHRKKARLTGSVLEAFETAAGMTPGRLVRHLRHQSPADAAAWLVEHGSLASLLDRVVGDPQRQLVSDHEDGVRRVERGYGKASRPEDYLDGFGKFLKEHLNEIPALLVVTQRPRELTRQQLKELKLALDEAGYNEKTLQTAWRETTNQDIAASIIGFIRQQALGEPLMPYEERVDRALKRILASQSWKPPQRQWLERIGKQMAKETVVDRAALDRGQFKSQGGFNRINKVFEGKLEQVLGELHDELWKEAG